MANAFQIEVTGNTAAVITLPKQLVFAVSRTINDLVERSQINIIEELKKEFHIRGNWYLPRTRFGINAGFSKPNNLEGSVGTAADWLLEEEGANDGTKTTDKGGADLADPNIANTRGGIDNKVRADQKAARLLAQGDFSTKSANGRIKLNRNTAATLGAFKKLGQYGQQLIYQRVAEGSGDGGVRRGKTGLPLRGRSEALRTKLVLKYILRPSGTVHVKQKKVIVNTAVKTMNTDHFGDRLSKNLLEALRTAKSK